MRVILSALIISIAVSGCGFIGFPGAYKIGIEQGNIVTQEMIDQLEPGMSRRQVRFVLGTPLIEDSFQPDRWDYRYEFSRGDQTFIETRLTVFFEGDALTHFDSTLPPSAGEAENPEANSGDEPVSDS
jgi:outer membrane protein assembly factor BamE